MGPPPQPCMRTRGQPDYDKGALDGEEGCAHEDEELEGGAVAVAGEAEVAAVLLYAPAVVIVRVARTARAGPGERRCGPECGGRAGRRLRWGSGERMRFSCGDDRRQGGGQWGHVR